MANAVVPTDDLHAFRIPPGWRSGLAGLLLGLSAAGCALALTEPLPTPHPSEPPATAARVVSAAPETTGDHFMVATADPAASEAAIAILRKGGSAADAAVAAQAVLGLVEPQSSGLGGGAFLLHWDGVTRKLIALDGRETAPRSPRADLFLDADGKPLDFMTAALSGRSVGVPGAVPGCALAPLQANSVSAKSAIRRMGSLNGIE